MQLHHVTLNKTNVFDYMIYLRHLKWHQIFSEEQIVTCGRNFSDEGDTFFQNLRHRK